MANPSTSSALSWLGLAWNALRNSLSFNNPPEVPVNRAEEGRFAREKRTEDDDIYKDIRYYEKYDGVRVGWPGLAQQQNYTHNRSIHRRFGTLRELLLLDLESRISYLELELEELNRIDVEANPNIIRGLPHQQSSMDEATLDRLTRRSTIMKELHDLLPKYDKLLLSQQELRDRLPRISRREHLDYVKQIVRDNMLDGSARRFIYDADDHITTRTDRQHEPFEMLIYGNNRLYGFLKTTFLSKKNSEGRQEVSKDRLKKISSVLTVTLTLGLLISPMLILFLAPLKNWHSALVVVFFGLTATMGMVLYGVKLDRAFLAMSAYMAVLVTFLANIQGGQCGI